MRFHVMCVLALTVAAPLSANEPRELTIGDKAPALQIEHWIHNDNEDVTPVKKFENGKVYIIEFWGTWCPPCIAMMPHLAEIQLHYGYEKLRLVSISTEKPKVIEAFLEQTVPGADKTYRQLTSVYSLAADPEQSVSSRYINASSQIGVPIAFLIGKTGLIEWSGNPSAMFRPLKQVIDGTWDRDEFKHLFQRSQQVLAEIRRLSMLRHKHRTEPELVLHEVEKAIERFANHDEEIIQVFHALRIRALMESGRDADAEAEIRRLLNGSHDHQILTAASILVQLPSNTAIDAKSLAELAISKFESIELSETLRDMPVSMQQTAQTQKQLMLVRLLVLAGQADQAITTANHVMKKSPDAQTKQMVEAVLKQLQAKPSN